MRIEFPSTCVLANAATGIIIDIAMRFEPVCYEHAARLIGRTPWEVSRDAALLAAAHLAAMETYGSDGCVVGLDIYNVEVEAYGGQIIEPPGEGVPAVGQPLCREVSDLLDLRLDPDRDGRLPLALEAARQIAQTNAKADVRLPLSGPFTIACHLLGMENMICSLLTDPEVSSRVLLQLAETQLQIGLLAHRNGFGVALFESSVTPPLLSPQLFVERVLPALEVVFNGLNAESRRTTQLIVGGDTIHILDSMLSLAPGYIICPVETDQPAFMSRLPSDPQLTTRINMNPAVFLPGNLDAAIGEIQRVVALGRKYSNTTVGSLIPYEADTAIIQQVADTVNE